MPLVSALLLFFVFIAMPARAEKKKDYCPHSSAAVAKWIKECSDYRESIETVMRELPERERKLSVAVEKLAKLNLDNIDLDKGAQCEQARMLTQILSEYRMTLTPLKEVERILKEKLVHEKSRGWKEYYTSTAYPDLARAKGCAAKCRDAKCEAKCEWNSNRSREWDQDLGPQKNPVAFADGIKKEWHVLLKETDKFIPFLSNKTKLYESRASAFERRSNAIHAQYRCEGSGIPHATPAPLTNQRREESQVAAVAPEGVSEQKPSGINGNPNSAASTGSGSGAGTNAARDLFRDQAETPEEKARKASVLLYTQGDFTSGSGFYVRTRDENGKESYRLVTAHHVPSQDHRNDSLPGYLNVNVYGANQRPIQDLTTKAGMSLGYGADATVRYDLDAPTFHRGSDVVALPAAPGNALELAQEGELPQADTEIVITGHRGGEGNLVYSSYRCNFKGYTPSLLQVDMAYLADCPGVPSNIGGMSGGAVLDARTGRVIGLVSGQSLETTNRVIVSPLYAKKNGELVAGPQFQMVQDHCYKKASAAESYRCSILPGYQFTTY